MEDRTERVLVIAEHAPIGVQLWPTDDPALARAFTVAEVIVDCRRVRDRNHNVRQTGGVTWVMEDGTTCSFKESEKVKCEVAIGTRMSGVLAGTDGRW